MRETIDYIITFLAQSHITINSVGYDSNPSSWRNYKLVVVPCGFFDDNAYATPKAEPSPYSFKNCTLLYGSPRIEQIDGTLVVYADIIASTYYFIARYNEYMHPDNNVDAHNRFTCNSNPYAAVPIVDIYSDIFRELLLMAGIEIEPIEQSINKIYLTHDIDILSYYRQPRAILGAARRAAQRKGLHPLSSIVKSILSYKNDPANNFDYLVSTDALLPKATKIYFLKAIKHPKKFDYPAYNLSNRDFRSVVSLLECQSNTALALHYGYSTHDKPQQIDRQMQYLCQSLVFTPRYARAHYLRALSTSQADRLILNNITDDFSVAYPDAVAYRLGTCRPTRYIDPRTKQLTRLTLHPLTAMDCTLSEPRYMNLPIDAAFEVVKKAIDHARKYNGDVVLLWHNHLLQPQSYHRQLYTKIITHLKSCM